MHGHGRRASHVLGLQTLQILGALSQQGLQLGLPGHLLRGLRVGGRLVGVDVDAIDDVGETLLDVLASLVVVGLVVIGIDVLVSHLSSSTWVPTAGPS